MSARLLVGDAAAVLGTLEAGSAQLCVTSPPYLGLRSYNSPDTVFGGDPLCSHEWQLGERKGQTGGDGSTSGLNCKRDDDGRFHPENKSVVVTDRTIAHATCRLCQAWRGQLGLEPTPDLFIEHLVSIFAEVRRMLHPTGVLAVNMGDSYASSGGPSRQHERVAETGGTAKLRATETGRCAPTESLPAGNLLGMPWRLAFALQRDGWILRSAVTCIKVAPMPESVSGCRWERCRVKSAPSRRAVAGTHHAEASAGVNNGHGARDGVNFDSRADWQDCPGCEKCAPDGLVLRWGSGRPTSAYEMLFIFAKSARYFWDAEAIRVGPADYTRKGGTAPSTAGGSTTNGIGSNSLHQMSEGGRNAWNYQRFEEASDVWEWRPSPFGGAHFATMPVSLPTWCIKAATPEAGCCSACGMPWARVVEREADNTGYPNGPGGEKRYAWATKGKEASTLADVARYRSATLGHRATCQCNAPSRPALVLDPFAGAGTTLLAASRLGRDSIGIELSSEYAQMSKERLTADQGLFSDIETE